MEGAEAPLAPYLKLYGGWKHSLLRSGSYRPWPDLTHNSFLNWTKSRHCLGVSHLGVCIRKTRDY